VKQVKEETKDVIHQKPLFEIDAEKDLVIK